MIGNTVTPMMIGVPEINPKHPANLGIGPWGTGRLPLPTPVLHIAGITKNSAGAALGSCSVELYATATDMPLERVTSDATTGDYSFSSVGLGQSYYVVAYKGTGATVALVQEEDGMSRLTLEEGGGNLMAEESVADVAGTTVNTLVGV